MERGAFLWPLSFPCLTLCRPFLSGIPFMQVEALDRDDRNSPHADLRFSLMEQTPRIPSSQMFSIDSVTGEVSLTEEGQSQPNTEGIIIWGFFIFKGKLLHIYFPPKIRVQGQLECSCSAIRTCSNFGSTSCNFQRPTLFMHSQMLSYFLRAYYGDSL